MLTARLVGWAPHATILASTVFRNLWTVDSASAILAGLAKAVTLSAWVEEHVHHQVSATVIPCKAGEVMYARFLGVLGSV